MKIITDDKHYNDIAAAIREKSGESGTFLPSEMAAAILGLKTGGGGNIAMGTFSATGSATKAVSFDSPMDKTPDFIVFYETDTSYGTSNRTKVGAGSTAPILVNGSTGYAQVLIYGTSSRNNLYQYSASYPITTSGNSAGCPIKNASATGFTACGYSTTYNLRGNYRYIAVSYGG